MKNTKSQFHEISMEEIIKWVKSFFEKAEVKRSSLKISVEMELEAILIQNQNNSIICKLFWIIGEIRNPIFQRRDFMNSLLNTIIDENKTYPIITICDLDLMSEWEKQPKHNQFNTLSNLNVDPRYRFFDSSIWFRYYFYNKNQPIINSENSFKTLCNEILNYLSEGLYSTIVAQEYREFSLRMAFNSFIPEIGNGGHASQITPFRFHSEALMKAKAKGVFEEGNFLGKELKWDFLLIDDYVEKKLRTNQGTPGQISKLDIIKSLLKVPSEEKERNSYLFNHLRICPTIEQALSKDYKNEQRQIEEFENASIQSNQHDIILLDYLFSNRNNNVSIPPQYGTKILAAIDDGDVKLKKSINYKYWIFPISVFSDAMQSELQEKGIQHLEKHWVLARGADPINTPNLFRFALFNFMKLQLNGLFPNGEEVLKTWLEHPLISSDELKKGQSYLSEGIYWARQLYNILLSKFGKIESVLRGHEKNTSALTNWIREERNRRKKSNADQMRILNSLREVIIQLAYSPIYDQRSTVASFRQLKERIETWKVLNSNLSKKELDKIDKQLQNLGELIFTINNDYE